MNGQHSLGMPAVDNELNTINEEAQTSIHPASSAQSLITTVSPNQPQQTASQSSTNTMIQTQQPANFNAHAYESANISAPDPINATINDIDGSMSTDTLIPSPLAASFADSVAIPATSSVPSIDYDNTVAGPAPTIIPPSLSGTIAPVNSPEDGKLDYEEEESRTRVVSKNGSGSWRRLKGMALKGGKNVRKGVKEVFTGPISTPFWEKNRKGRRDGGDGGGGVGTL